MAYDNKCSAVSEMDDCLTTAGTGRKLGRGYATFWGELSPHVAQCGLGRDLPLYQVAS